MPRIIAELKPRCSSSFRPAMVQPWESSPDRVPGPRSRRARPPPGRVAPRRPRNSTPRSPHGCSSPPGHRPCSDRPACYRGGVTQIPAGGSVPAAIHPRARAWPRLPPPRTATRCRLSTVMAPHRLCGEKRDYPLPRDHSAGGQGELQAEGCVPSGPGLGRRLRTSCHSTLNALETSMRAALLAASPTASRATNSRTPAAAP